MPCLSSSAVSALNESISVSKAESQLALPLAITTFFGSSVIGSPKGSAVWTGAAGAGVCAAAGGTGVAAGLAAGLGEGLAAGLSEELEGPALGSGEGLAETAGAGVAADCASAGPALREIATGRSRAARPAARTKTKRKLLKYMGYSPGPCLMSRSVGKVLLPNTQGASSSHDSSVISPAGFAALAKFGAIRHIERTQFGYFDECARQPRLRQDERHRQRDCRGRSARYLRPRYCRKGHGGGGARGGISCALRSVDGAAAAAARRHRGVHPDLQQ